MDETATGARPVRSALLGSAPVRAGSAAPGFVAG